MPSNLLPAVMTTPMLCVLATDSALAALFGFHPMESATSSTLLRVFSETPGLPFNAYETALFDTPAAFATSVMVTLDFALAMSRGLRFSLVFSQESALKFQCILMSRQRTDASICEPFQVTIARCGIASHMTRRIEIRRNGGIPRFPIPKIPLHRIRTPPQLRNQTLK